MWRREFGFTVMTLVKWGYSDNRPEQQWILPLHGSRLPYLPLWSMKAPKCCKLRDEGRDSGRVISSHQGKSTNYRSLIIKGSLPPFPMSNFVEVIGIADTNNSIQAEISLVLNMYVGNPAMASYPHNYGQFEDSHYYNVNGDLWTELDEFLCERPQRYKSFDWRVRTHFRHVALEDLCEVLYFNLLRKLGRPKLDKASTTSKFPATHQKVRLPSATKVGCVYINK
ncbi:hypothetical protein Scep_027431 [Stephania cephalantha]|uniref:Uncharacterized protein n=1 Tax=Stephania cephalantha TaxID=152367 RepID=A0AAP0HIH9_9MAGN